MQNDTCYILALFKRDDGERLLLGSGFYEFDKGQKHFNPNTFANDIVELQGTDGQLLAGQVRRSTSQSFDGVIGDGTTTKTVVEQKRREFFLFFRKQHHYTVVYIFPDGTAIKRERGYITDAPAVQELYQVQPKWHIALAFEDVNYYSYAEDAQGNEIYSFEAELGLANIEDGGLIWDNDGAVSSPTGLGNIRISGGTFQQTYTGINLLDNSEYNTGSSNSVSYTRNADGTYTLDGTASAFTSFRMGYVQFDSETQVYLTGAPEGASMRTFSINLMKNGSDHEWQTDAFAEGRAYTLEANTPYYFAIVVRKNSNVNGLVFKPQIELGSYGSDYQPYVGGAPSPNPDYPQPVQTVTGEQTITINGTTYPLDLGTIELCKLDTKQDYIWQDGSDWKVRKATHSVTLTGAEQWQYPNVGSSATFFQLRDTNWELAFGNGTLAPTPGTNVSVDPSYFKSPKFSGIDAADTNMKIYQGIGKKGGFFRISLLNTWGVSTVEQLQTWLGQNNVEVTYVLATATDTTITDATLIAQLDAIAEAMDADGKPTAIVPAGNNLAAIITGEPNGTGGYIFAPSTGGGPIIVTVNGVDDANPVWHVYGPATNPTLTNSTTGEALTWNGTVPANQELIIDMGQQTATLEGANVFEFVSGSWVQLAPGQNRISYTAANTTRSSKVYWNEVVG